MSISIGSLGWITLPPSTIIPGITIPKIEIGVYDNSGNLKTSSDDEITISPSNNKQWADGNNKKKAVSGIATFDDLVYNGSQSFTMEGVAEDYIATTPSNIIIPEFISLPDNILRCPYCLTPIHNQETNSYFSQELIDFYNSMGVFFWNKDPIKTAHGSKYKWYEEDLPDEYFYKDKLYLIYHKLPTPDEYGNIINNPRRNIGFSQISKEEIKFLQENREWLEDYIGIGDPLKPDFEKTIFTSIDNLDEGSSENQIRKTAFRELQESTLNIASFLGLSYEDFFNYTENGKFVIKKNINDEERIQAGFYFGNIIQWHNHIRNTHVEDFRHNFLGYWIEDFSGVNYSFEKTNTETAPMGDPHVSTHVSEYNEETIESDERYWLPASAYINTTAGYINPGSSATRVQSISQNNIQWGIGISVSAGTVPLESSYQEGTTRTQCQIYLSRVFTNEVVINKHTEIVIENFTQDREGYSTVLPGAIGVETVGKAYVLLEFTNSLFLRIYASGTGAPTPPNNIVWDNHNNVIIKFDTLPEYWGKSLYRMIFWGLAEASATIRYTEEKEYRNSASVAVNGTIGRIKIYSCSFRGRSGVSEGYWEYPTGYEERDVDPLPN